MTLLPGLPEQVYIARLTRKEQDAAFWNFRLDL